MTLAGFLAYALALGIAAAVPGPGVVALVARALGAGFRHGMAFAAGLVIGDLVYLSAAVFGLALVADMLGSLFVLVRYGGAAYLLWLAWRLWRSAGDGTQVSALTNERASRSFLAGLVVTLGNPKTIVFYLALVPTLVDLRHVTVSDYLVLALLTTAVLVMVMTPYAALAARARGFLRRPAMLARLNRSAALFLAGAAVWTLARRA